MANAIAANVFAILGIVIWSFQTIPQIRLNYIRRSTEGVSLFCFSCWFISCTILAPYLIIRKLGVALTLQICILSFLNMVVLFQHFYFDRKVNPKILAVAAVVVAITTFGFTIGLYYMMDRLDGHETVVNIVVSLVSSVFMLAGYLPQIYEIYISKNNPEAISMIFVCMDFFGGAFAIISLSFIEPFDWLSFSTYLIVPLSEIVQFSLIVYYNRLVKTGAIVYQDEGEPVQPRKHSLWKRTHRTKTLKSNVELTKREKGSNPV